MYKLIQPRPQISQYHILSGLTQSRFQHLVQLKERHCFVPCRALCSASKVTLKDKYKSLIRKYGAVAIGFHSTVWTCTLLASYTAVSYGVDVVALVNNLPFSNTLNLDLEACLQANGAERYANFLVAYSLTTLTGPVRIGLDVIATPWIADRPYVQSFSSKIQYLLTQWKSNKK